MTKEGHRRLTKHQEQKHWQVTLQDCRTGSPEGMVRDIFGEAGEGVTSHRKLGDAQSVHVSFAL